MPKLVGMAGATFARQAAGEINGISLLAADLRALSVRASAFLPAGFQLSSSKYDAIVETFRRRAGETDAQAADRVSARYSRMTGDEVLTLVAGTIGVVGDAVVRAKAIARLTVTSEDSRADSHRLQASIIEPARLMWQMLEEMLSNMESRQLAASGLGVIPVPVIVALIAAGAVLLTAAIVAGVYYADARFRVAEANRAARSICDRRGGCTAAEEARIRHELQLGPFDQMMDQVGANVGRGIGTAALILGVGGATLAAGAAWYYWFGGKKWISSRT